MEDTFTMLLERRNSIAQETAVSDTRRRQSLPCLKVNTQAIVEELQEYIAELEHSKALMAIELDKALAHAAELKASNIQLQGELRKKNTVLPVALDDGDVNLTESRELDFYAGDDVFGFEANVAELEIIVKQLTSSAKSAEASLSSPEPRRASLSSPEQTPSSPESRGDRELTRESRRRIKPSRLVAEQACKDEEEEEEEELSFQAQASMTDDEEEDASPRSPSMESTADEEAALPAADEESTSSGAGEVEVKVEISPRKSRRFSWLPRQVAAAATASDLCEDEAADAVLLLPMSSPVWALGPAGAVIMNRYARL
eukprot:TRINITY_DN67508_c0_g1_i1.p1 TRINITY_DN67508_c0_g1~~TRINITY_DN67508_c0_g1_i1.p1  ORF type:complete len:315 (-),score=107.41 TRINITY_DN67508_c0_g1_i1:44-988(-)